MNFIISHVPPRQGTASNESDLQSQVTESNLYNNDFIYIYIKLKSCLSVCPSKFRWLPMIFSRPEGHMEVIFVPNEALIIQE